MTAESKTRERGRIPAKRLWFGFAASAVAWSLAGILNVLFAWQACLGGEAGSGIFSSTEFRVLLGFITFGLLAVAIAAGLTSYRNWRLLSDKPEFIDAEGRERQEFMAIAGVFVSASLGIGIALFAIPIYVLGICVRYR
jgi:hypothetical protein